MNDVMKIVQALEDSNILLKGMTKTIKNETKNKNFNIFKEINKIHRHIKKSTKNF